MFPSSPPSAVSPPCWPNDGFTPGTSAATGPSATKRASTQPRDLSARRTERWAGQVPLRLRPFSGPNAASRIIPGASFSFRRIPGSVSVHRRIPGSSPVHSEAKNSPGWTEHEPFLCGWPKHEPFLCARAQLNPFLHTARVHFLIHELSSSNRPPHAPLPYRGQNLAASTWSPTNQHWPPVALRPST